MLYFIFFTLLKVDPETSSLRLFDFSAFRMAGAAITAFLLGVVLAPRMIRKFKEMRVTENTEKKDAAKLAEMHRPKANTPTMGGLILFLTVVVSTVLWGQFNHPFNPYLLMGVILVALLGAVGFVDDYIKLTHARRSGLTKRQKFLLQVAITGLVSVCLYYSFASITLSDKSYAPIHDRYPDILPASGADYGRHVVTDFQLPFVSNPKYYISLSVVGFVLVGMLVMVGSSNAVNLTDGLDGLAISCSLIVVMVFTVIAYAVGNYVISDYLRITYVPNVGELAVFGAAVLGAGLAFLWYNCYPAEVFMGDTGSLPLGGLIGYMAVVTRNELLLFMVGGVFVMETLSVMMQVWYFKATHGKRIFRCSPLHHHFEYKGWPEAKVTMRFIIIGVVLALASLATLKIR